MHLAVFGCGFFYRSNLSAISRIKGKAVWRVPVVGSDELPGLSAKLSPAKPQKSCAMVRQLGHMMSVSSAHFG